MKKLPYREGTWFAVPLEGGGFGTGIVARSGPRGRILLAYFFGPKRSSVPALAEVESLKAQDAVLAIKISDLGLFKGMWPIIGNAEVWQRSDWPMPVFVRREGRYAWLVHYADDYPNRVEAEEPAPPNFEAHLRIDSIYGFGAAEFHLTKALTAEPN